MPSLHAAARAGGSSRDAMTDGHCKAEADAEAEELKPFCRSDWSEFLKSLTFYFPGLDFAIHSNSFVMILCLS